MSNPPAYCVYRELTAKSEHEMQFSQHYLLYAAEGMLRLEARGKRWSLPPARAALIEADEPLKITIPRRILCCSVLFSPDLYEAPPVPIAVFAMTPLTRVLALECGAHGPGRTHPDPEARLLFDTLFMLTRRLVNHPCPAWVPAGRSESVRKALLLTEATLDEGTTFEGVASGVHTAPRTLARRFNDELGMPWHLVRRRLRMIRATEALAETTDSVTEIALSVGYASSSAFNAAFREFAGMTPTQFRSSVKPA